MSRAINIQNKALDLHCNSHIETVSDSNFCFIISFDFPNGVLMTRKSFYNYRLKVKGKIEIWHIAKTLVKRLKIDHKVKRIQPKRKALK